MKKSWIGTLGFLCFLIVPFAAVVYFDFPKLKAHAPIDVWAARGFSGQTTVAEVDSFERRGAILRQLPEGNIVLLAPEAMKVGEIREIEARVGYKVPIEQLKDGSFSDEQVVQGALRVAVQMAASLSGSAFSIEPVTPDEQSVAAGFPTVWKWNVEAKQDGNQELEATLFAIVFDADTVVRHRIASIVETVLVRVQVQTWGEWLESASKSVDAVKAIVVAFFGAGTVAAGWLTYVRGRNGKRGISSKASDGFSRM
jgi:hypothetical protein